MTLAKMVKKINPSLLELAEKTLEPDLEFKKFAKQLNIDPKVLTSVFVAGEYYGFNKLAYRLLSIVNEKGVLNARDLTDFLNSLTGSIEK